MISTLLRLLLLLGAWDFPAAASPAAVQAGGVGPRPPVRVLFDTDVGADIDDAGALAMLHALADLGEIEILAIGIVNGHPAAAPYTDAVNTWYGRPDLPVGVIRSTVPFAEDLYLSSIVADYAHDLTHEQAPNVVALYRRVLAAQPDGSVTLVAVGPPTNIADLLNSAPDEHSSLSGTELVRRKVVFYGAGGNGAGQLPKGRPGFNYKKDLPAARRELEQLPARVPMVFAGGSGDLVRAGSCYRDAAPDHIIRKSYEAYYKGASDLNRPTWDQLRLLYACRPSARSHFVTSTFGDIIINPRGELVWSAVPQRNRAYAYVRDLAPVAEQVTALMMHRPVRSPPPKGTSAESARE